MEKMLDDAPCGFFSINHHDRISKVNNRFLGWLGYERQEVLGKHIDTFLTNVNKMFIHTYFFPNIQLKGSIEEVYINLTNSSGESVPILMNARQYIENGETITDCMFIQMKQRIDYEMELRSLHKTTEKAYKDREEAFIQLEKVYTEIEQKQDEILKMNEELLILSKTDKLTAIPNRRFYQEELAKHIEKYYNKNIIFSILMIDIDRFKKVNDNYGHIVGDNILIQLASVLTDQIRLNDFLARLGGEEFVIILPETAADKAIEVANKLNKNIENTKWVTIDRLTVSIGIATFSKGANEVSILHDADQALYRAKENGRNCSIHFNDI